MQVPAPFEYERATSVDHAIGLLDRLGSAARLVAGGHSLLPMMKLRLANFEYLIDINDLHDELGYITVEPDQIRIGAMTRHRELLESDELAAAFPIFRDAERVIADPVVRNRGTHRRLAVPGRPVGGPVRGLHDARRQLRDPRQRRRAGGDDGGVLPRAVRDRRRRRRDPHRGADPDPPGWVQRLREGRAAGRRLGRSCPPAPRCGWTAGVITRRPGRAGRGRAEHHRHPGDLRRAARAGALRGAVRAQAGEIAAAELQPGHRHARQRGVQAAPRRRADPAGAAHARWPGSPDGTGA